MSERVFVYGTLRRGDSRHGVSSFVKLATEEAFLPESFNMLDLGGFPGLVLAPSSRDETVIRGEVHEYEHLDTLDAIEGYRASNPKSGLYNRIRVVPIDDDGAELEPCWVYIFNRSGRFSEEAIIECGDWFEHKGLYRDQKESTA